MTDRAKEVFRIIDKIEGGDKVHTDSGGLTKHGISQRAFPDLDIANLTYADAEAIFRVHYWDKVRADKLPAPVDFFVADAAFNQGEGTARKFLQRALNAFGAGIAVDGVIGKYTLRALDKITERHGADELGYRVMVERAMAYPGTRNFDKYGRGWFYRLFKVTDVAPLTFL